MGFWAGFERWGEKERKTVNMAVKEKTWDCIHSWLIVGEIDSVGQQGKGSSFIFLSWFGILWIIGVIVVFSMIFFHRILENLFYNCVLCQVKCFLKTKMPPTFSMVGIPYPLRKSKPMYQKKQSKPPNFRSSRKKEKKKETEMLRRTNTSHVQILICCRKILSSHGNHSFPSLVMSSLESQKFQSSIQTKFTRILETCLF